MKISFTHAMLMLAGVQLAYASSPNQYAPGFLFSRKRAVRNQVNVVGGLPINHAPSVAANPTPQIPHRFQATLKPIDAGLSVSLSHSTGSSTGSATIIRSDVTGSRGRGSTNGSPTGQPSLSSSTGTVAHQQYVDVRNKRSLMNIASAGEGVANGPVFNPSTPAYLSDTVLLKNPNQYRRTVRALANFQVELGQPISFRVPNTDQWDVWVPEGVVVHDLKRGAIVLLARKQGDPTKTAALKLCMPGLHNDCERELALHMRLDSPYILKLYGYSSQDGNIMLLLEWADYGTLMGVFNRINALPNVRIEERVAKKIILDIAKALAYLHSVHVEHGDVNYGNVFLVKNPTDTFGFTVKIGDFDRARTHHPLAEGANEYLMDGYWNDEYYLGLISFILFHGKETPIRRDTHRGKVLDMARQQRVEDVLLDPLLIQ